MKKITLILKIPKKVLSKLFALLNFSTIFTFEVTLAQANSRRIPGVSIKVGKFHKDMFTSLEN
jgi:hypothetical protein